VQLLPPAAAVLLLACGMAAWRGWARTGTQLTETRVCDEINSSCFKKRDQLINTARRGHMSTCVSDAGSELGAIKNALCLYSLLDSCKHIGLV
jgi:hypothetical protein